MAGRGRAKRRDKDDGENEYHCCVICAIGWGPKSLSGLIRLINLHRTKSAVRQGPIIHAQSKAGFVKI